MNLKKTYNILMYSHDTYGLGHIRRTMAIASHLRGPNTNVLILTGSPIAGRFRFPEQVDFVRIPGMIKTTNEEYQPLSIKIDPEHAMNIRKSIISATAQTFRPDLFIVDKEPLGLKREVLPTLEWLREESPHTRTILGLRDIMDDAESTRRDWEKRGVYEILERLYSEVWVYGRQNFYDPVSEYRIPAAVSEKMVFTGYIPRTVPNKKAVAKTRKRYLKKGGKKLVVVTTGGGGDGYVVMDTFLSMLESEKTMPDFSAVLVTGPFLSKQWRDEIFDRAKRLGVKAIRFFQPMEELIAAADLVVSMGGYNTICEILTQGTLSLVIPRETPRKEQLIRAQVLNRQKLVDYIPWDVFSARILREKIAGLIADPEPYRETVAAFQLTGLDVMRRRLQEFRNISYE